MKYIIALDQGTTSSRAVVFDENARAVAAHNVEFRQIYPKPGWVEHDPKDILDSQIAALKLAVEKSGVPIDAIEAIGITNQRETTLVWDRISGKPVYNAIVWQCRRTAPLVEQLKRDGLDEEIRSRTGLLPDAYFSGTKLQWILDTVPAARSLAERGQLCFGTVDSFLAWHLTGGRVHITDATNAARTMLFNIHRQDWDESLLQALSIPRALLPEVTDSSAIVGTMKADILGREIPLAALAGDQHAALFGQGCFEAGQCKNTYGTGCFLLMNTGETPIRSTHNLITTLAWRVDGKPVYALEGSVFVAGAAIQWLRDELRIVKSAAATETLAAALPDNGDVYFVPAFTGLGAPYWDMYGRGTILGLTRGSSRAHIVRAALESIAYQSADVVNAMAADAKLPTTLLRVDGGASANNFLMQFQADILNCMVVRPSVIETTALGAAMLAGRAVGLWNDRELQGLSSTDRAFAPNMDETCRKHLLSRWREAVARCKGWAEC